MKLLCYSKWNHIIITPLFCDWFWSLKRWHRASTGEIYVPDNTKVLSVKFYPIEKVKKARYGLLTFCQNIFTSSGWQYMPPIAATTTPLSRGSKCMVSSPSLVTTSNIPPPWARLRDTSAMLATAGTDALITLISQPTTWPARYTSHFKILHKRTSKIFNFSGRRHMDRELANLCRHHLMLRPNHLGPPWRDRDHLDRLGICRDRRDRRSCKIFVICVNFSENNAVSYIFYKFTHTLMQTFFITVKEFTHFVQF